MKDINEKLEALSPEKRARLARQLQSKRARGKGTAPVRRPPSDAPLPLSFAQQRLWFVDQLQPGSPAYNMPTALRLEGLLDVDALRRAFSELVRRHESLRTLFREEGGSPIQVIQPPAALLLPVVDLGGHEDREAEAHRLAQEEASRPFNLATGPLLRVSLLRLSPRQHVLLLNQHHIVSDGWSTGVLVREMGALYEAFSSGRPSPLAELPLQYADYAVWQRSWLKDEALAQQVDWWKQQLSGAPAHLELATDFPRPPVQSFLGGAVHFQLPLELSRALEALAQQEGASLFMALLASTHALLARYSGQDDIVLGSPIAGRRFSELEGLIGFFVNTLAFRARLDGLPSFRQLLARERESALGAYAHQDLPFEKLVEELHPPRDLSRSPIFQAMLSLQNAPDAAVSPSSPLAIHPFEVDNPSAKFDLVFGFSSSAEGLRGVINFGAGLFREDSVRRMAGHLRVLLEAAVLSPDSPLAHLPLLPPDERKTLLIDWNQAAAPVADEACVHELFGAQALRTPGAQALAFEGQHLTYLQLHQRSNQLAHALRSMGVGPEVPVALCMERSLELVVAVLGVLKAGGAYVPLDPAYPAQRLAFMLRDCQAPVLLTQPHLRSLLPAYDGHVLALDEALLAPWPTTAPASETTADNLAYVIYTSGSTGTPKGVWVPHRGIVRLVQGSAYMRFGPEETFLQLASISFDASTFELWGALLHGARLVIFPPQTPSLQELARFISSHAISTLFLTTALFDQMMAQHPEALDGVRQLLTGGEINPVHRFRQRLERGKSIIAAYGPTENTTFSTCFPLSSVEQVGASVSLGRPIANTTAYVLDRHLRPVPAGVPGELFVGGAGLARGYLGRPELTAERFIPHPFSDAPGARLYRTGDKARWRADGTLEFLGRVDFQVKLRGFRIELGEVESALRAHPGVEDAVTVVREEVPGDKRLVAYVVASLPSQATPEALRAHLRQHLPEYMVPSAFVLLPALPLTANGKVNRQSLPAPDGRASSAAGAYVAPRDSTERQLAEIWAEILKLERVGVTDDFFALGAHSLLAIQAVSRIRAAFGVDLPLRTLFEKPNIEALARALAPPDAGGLRAGGVRGEAPAPPAPGRPTRFGRAEGPTSMAQSRWLGYAGPNRPRGQGNVPQCVRLTGRLDVEALEQALSMLLERHEVLRTHFVRTGEGFGFKVSPAAPFRLERLDFSGLLPEQREEALRQRVYQDASLPFDLMAPPMFRAWLYILGPAEHVLLLLTHHIAWDGWSQAILFQEVSLAYQAYARGQTPQLPEPRLQYSDFAWWQHEHLRGAYLESVQSYWRKQLAGGVTMVDFPLDKPRPATRSYSTLSATAHFPGELSAALKALCQREGATLYMLAMAAYQALLALRSGVRDVTVFSNVGGRDHFEVENLIGCFTNIVLIRTNLEGDPTFRELLTRVREGVLGALAHSALPYHRVLEMIGQHPDSASARTFPGLNLQSFQRSGAPSAEAGELQLERVNIPLGGGLLANMFFFISEEADHRVSVMAQANGDLYEALTVERILEDYQRLMEVACAEPDRRLSSLLSPGART